MTTRHQLWLLAIAALAVALLACNTVTTLPERLAGRATAAPPSLPLPNAAATPSGGADNGATPLTVGDGPTVGTPREARVAQADGAPLLDDLAAETYSNEEVNRVGARLTYTIKLDKADTQVLWGYGWCASTRDILTQNLETMQVEFSVNGEPVDIAQFDVADGRSSDGLECRSYLTVVSGWPSGKATLETKITFTQKINDGIADYEAGDQVFTYEVTAP